MLTVEATAFVIKLEAVSRNVARQKYSNPMHTFVLGVFSFFLYLCRVLYILKLITSVNPFNHTQQQNTARLVVIMSDS